LEKEGTESTLIREEGVIPPGLVWNAEGEKSLLRNRKGHNRTRPWGRKTCEFDKYKENWGTDGRKDARLDSVCNKSRPSLREWPDPQFSRGCQGIGQ